MPDLSWRDAIVKVLESHLDPVHYVEIANEIIQRQLRTAVGATPADSVHSVIGVSIRSEGASSPFQKVSRGYFALKGAGTIPQEVVAEDLSEDTPDTGLINAFGMFWARDKVRWASTPKILGQQQSGSTQVDFCAQQGVYLLYDSTRTIYVGRTTARGLGTRLYEHTRDRLSDRWDRFSWFGVYPVTETGTLRTQPASGYTTEALIVTMEALLIEGLEPPQNRKGGDDFRAAEFQQTTDPSIEKEELLARLGKLPTA